MFSLKGLFWSKFRVFTLVNNLEEKLVGKVQQSKINICHTVFVNRIGWFITFVCGCYPEQDGSKQLNV